MNKLENDFYPLGTQILLERETIKRNEQREEGRKERKWGKGTEGRQTRRGKKEGKKKTILESDKYYRRKKSGE